MVLSCAEKHTSYEIGCRDSRGARNNLEAPEGFDDTVTVLTR